MKEQLPEKFVRRLVDMANANRARMDESDEKASFKIVDQIAAESDVLFGVWQDAREPYGVGLHCIKGIERIAEVMHAGLPRNLRLGAVPCVSLEQALAAEQRFGNLKH